MAISGFTMETVQWGHADSRMPFCVDSISVFDGVDNLIAEIKENYQTRVVFRFDLAVQTGQLTFVLSNSSERIPVAVFGVEIK